MELLLWIFLSVKNAQTFFWLVTYQIKLAACCATKTIQHVEYPQFEDGEVPIKRTRLLLTHHTQRQHLLRLSLVPSQWWCAFTVGMVRSLLKSCHMNQTLVSRPWLRDFQNCKYFNNVFRYWASISYNQVKVFFEPADRQCAAATSTQSTAFRMPWYK